MNFRDKTKERLADYKAETFPGLGDGKWKKNMKHYSHILPEDNKFDNLLPRYKNLLISYLHEMQIKRHSDFHHLNSSQVMCLNFFFPLYYERSLELVTTFLGLTNEKINYNTVEFEKKGLEATFGSRKPTCFDFYFETLAGKKLYFEIKYTEGEFGKDSETDPIKRHKKFERFYSNLLEPLKDSYHNSQSFSNHYQILRNLIHINEDSFVIFLYPKNNIGIRNGAEKVKADFLTSKYHNHFFSTTWENLFDSVSASIANANLKAELEDFRKKYFD